MCLCACVWGVVCECVSVSVYVLVCRHFECVSACGCVGLLIRECVDICVQVYGYVSVPVCKMWTGRYLNG